MDLRYLEEHRDIEANLIHMKSSTCTALASEKISLKQKLHVLDNEIQTLNIKLQEESGKFNNNIDLLQSSFQNLDEELGSTQICEEIKKTTDIIQTLKTQVAECEKTLSKNTVNPIINEEHLVLPDLNDLSHVLNKESLIGYGNQHFIKRKFADFNKVIVALENKITQKNN